MLVDTFIADPMASPNAPFFINAWGIFFVDN